MRALDAIDKSMYSLSRLSACSPKLSKVSSIADIEASRIAMRGSKALREVTLTCCESLLGHNHELDLGMHLH